MSARRELTVSLFRWHFAQCLPSLLEHEPFASWKSNNFSAFIANKAHEVAYFLLLGAFAERPAEGKFTVLIKPLPLFAQICRCPIHVRPVVRWISVSFRHVYPVCVVFVVRNPTTSTPCYVFTTCTPCWITSQPACLLWLVKTTTTATTNNNCRCDTISPAVYNKYHFLENLRCNHTAQTHVTRKG